jgi:hypothetical protein
MAEGDQVWGYEEEGESRLFRFWKPANDNQLQYNQQLWGTPICRFYSQGFCAKGETCTFNHSPLLEARLALPPYHFEPRLSEEMLDNTVVHDGALKGDMCESSEDIVGHVFELAKDQHGCRLLQRVLEEEFASFDVIFSESFECIYELMMDRFGNYLCQKLIEFCDLNGRLMIIEKISGQLIEISLNIHGTRVIQKLIEVISSEREMALMVEALTPYVVQLAKDLNGNHVIQRCLHHFPSPFNQFIYDAISYECVSVATHKHGCCVLQRCIDYASAAQKDQLIVFLIQNTNDLVQDAFGNYVVQYILDLNVSSVSRSIMEKLIGNLVNLTTQKFSSNVIEKCLQIAEADIQEKMVDELCNSSHLSRLLHDPYANYVIQKSLSVSKPEKFAKLVEVMRPHITVLKSTAFGKRIYSKIIKKFPLLQ